MFAVCTYIPYEGDDSVSVDNFTFKIKYILYEGDDSTYNFYISYNTRYIPYEGDDSDGLNDRTYSLPVYPL